MNDNGFILDLLALLDKQKSKTQINTDIKNLEQLVRKLKLTATLARGNTKTEINQTIKQIEAQLRHVKIQARMDHRQLNREINAALRNVSARDIQLNISSNSERLNAQIRRTVSQAREFVSRNPISVNIDLKKEKLLNQLAAFTNKHTKINESSYWLREAERLRGVIGSVTDRNGLRNATDQFQVFTSGVRATGYAAVSTTDKIKGMVGNVAKLGNYFGLAFVAVNKFRQSLNTLKENDTIITEISKTSEMTAQQLRELGDEAFKVASKYGQVSGNYLTAVQEMARSGYEMTSKELGELSLLAQSAGGMTAEMANNYILATDVAYKYGGSIDRLNAALDGANYISNKNSASLSDIADATRVSASFAANAGVAIDELTAAEATMVAATKRSGSEMGRAFRSIILNLQQVSGEFDGEVIDEESLKKVEDRCHSLGVELEYVKDGVATLRNPMEVLKDLAEVYNSLPDNSADKQGLISDIGGKYHANALSALLSRWDMYEKMLGEFSQGTGSALEEANKTADSWAGRVAQLQNTWDEFVSSLTSKDAVKGGVSFLDNTIQAFTKLSDTLGAIPVIMTAINGAMTAFNKNYGITQVFNGGKLNVQGNFMGIDITAFKAQKKHFSEAENAIGGWNVKLQQGITDVNSFNNATVQNNKHLKEYLATTSKDAPASLQGYKAYLNAAGVSTDALRLKTILMTSALTMGLSLGIQAVVTGISKLVNAENEAVQSAKEAADAYKESSSSMDDYISRYSELREQLLAAKGNEEETYNVKKQLLDLQTELNEKYGEEHGYLNLVTDAYKDQTEAIKELNKESANKYLNENEQGITTAKRKMESVKTYDLSYAIAKTPDNEEFMEEIVRKYEKDGMSILDAGESFYIKLDADPEDAYGTINSFMTDVQEKAKELGNGDLFRDTVSNIASDSLNKAKETLDKYQEIYKQAQMAQIVSDDSLSDGYNEAVSAVEAYNEAVLKSEDPYNDENVNKAWNDLQTVKQGIQENEAEWGKYSSVMEDVFSAADDKVYSFYQSLKNDAEVKELAGKLKGLSDIDLQAMSDDGNNGDSFDALYEKAQEYGLEVQDLIDLLIKFGYVHGEISREAQDAAGASSFQEAWQSLSSTKNENLKSLKDDLLSLAEAGRLTTEAFTETNGSGDFLSMLGITSNDTQKINNLISQINKLKSSADQLSSMKKGISSLSENLYNRKQEPDVVIDADVLAGMDSVLKEQTAEWEKYVTVLGDASSSMDDVQKATDELATAYVNSNNFLANLTETNKDYYVSQLDAMGVENSAEVVEERLNAQREVAKYRVQALALATKDLAASNADAANATYENSKAFAEQSGMTDIAKASLADLIAKEQIFSVTPLNTAVKINELNNLALAYLGVANAISVSSAMGSDSKYWKSTDDYNKTVLNSWNNLIKTQSPVSLSIGTGGSNARGKGQSEKGKDKKEETKKQFSEVFDWIERRVKKFQKSFDRWVKQAETAVTSGAVNRYYKKAASAARKQVSVYGKAYSRYMAQADSIGLDEKYASKVRNGTIDIESIRAEGTEEEIKQYEELADKIKEYQDWYDKAQDSMDSFTEAAEKLANIPLDKAARKAELFSNAVDLLGKRMDNAISAKTKNKLVDRQTKEEKKTLNAQKSAQKETGKQLKAARRELRKSGNLNADDGITKKERSKIKSAVKKNKEADLSFFKENSAGYKAAVKYNEALKANRKATDGAKAAQQDYNRWLVEAGKMKFDNIADRYEKKLRLIGYEMSALGNKVAEIEAAGRKVDKAYYESQKKVNASTLAKYREEKAALEESIKGIKKGTDEWYDAKDAIQQVEDAISGCVEEAYDLNNAISQLHFDMFGDVSDSIKRVITEQEFLQGLFAHEKNADNETGNFTEAGIAKLGSLSASYHASKSNAERDEAEVAELQRMFDSESLHSDLLGITFNSLDDLKAKLDETYTKWQDDIGETYRLESEISDLMKEKYQAELDMLEELINAKKEALNAEKDLHDYQRTLNEKTESISTIQKQIAAYSGDTSQEGMAKLQKLQKELADREEDLRETEYDRYISDQVEMLGKLYNEYEELMEKKLDDFMSLVSEGLQTAEENTSIISSYLGKVASDNGYTEETKGLFSGISASISGNVDRVISAMNAYITQRSGTGAGGEQGGSGGGTPSAGNGTPAAGSQGGSGNQNNANADKTDWKSSVRDFIRANAVKASKKKSEYSDINKAVYDNRGKLYQGKGKVLPWNSLKELAKLIGVRYTGNNSKDGTFYKKLKTLKIPGFKKGGVVSVDDIEEQVRENGDTSLVSVQGGEGILTKEETRAVKELAENAEKPGKTIMINGAECTPVSHEDILGGFIARSHTGMDTANVDILYAIKNITPDFSNMLKPDKTDIPPVTNNSHSNVVNIDSITLPNVKNYDDFKNQMLHDIQAEKKAGNVFHGVAGVSQMSDGRKLNRMVRGF